MEIIVTMLAVMFVVHMIGVAIILKGIDRTTNILRQRIEKLERDAGLICKVGRDIITWEDRHEDR